MAGFFEQLSGPIAHALRGTGDRAPNNLLGIAAMLVATAVFVTGDVIMKIMGTRMPTGETMFIRGVIGALLAWALLWRMGMLGDVRRHLQRIIGWRTAAEVGASCSFQSGLTRLPFADVGAIGQINPLVLTAAAAIFLGEKVGWRRWTATAVGLVGALLIIRPGGATFQWASLLILSAVFFSVSRDMFTRKMAPGFSPFVLAAISTVAIGLSSLLFLPFETWIWPAPLDVFWLAFPAMLMMAGQVLVVISIRAGEVSAVVPFRYAAMLWSLAYSFLIWREVPDALTFLGIAIVCSAGLYTFHREQVRRREAAMRSVGGGDSLTSTQAIPLATSISAVQSMVAHMRPLARRSGVHVLRAAGGITRLSRRSLAAGRHHLTGPGTQTMPLTSAVPDEQATGTKRTAVGDLLVGVGAMTGAMLAFSAGDTIFKLMGSTMPVGEMLFIRGVFASILVITFCAYTGVLPQTPRLFTPLIGVRVTMESLCSVLFFVGLMHMSFADAAAISQFTPLMVMAGAAVFLGEAVGWRRWSAAAVGFLGVLLVIKPGTGAFQPMALVMLASLVCVAARDLITRLVPKDLPTSLLTAASAVSGMLIGLAMAPFEAAWYRPSLGEILTLAVCAATILAAYMFIIIAMRHGPTSVTSPFRYTYMLFATLSSLIIFRERPDLWSWFGIALIIGAGLYMLHREHAVARQKAAPLGT